MVPVIVLLVAGITLPSPQAHSQVFNLGRVIASWNVPAASDGASAHMEWDPHEKSLAIFPYRVSDKGHVLAVWPEMDTVSLNLESGDSYLRWSPDGHQILVGDHDNVYLLERRHMRVLRHLTHVTNAVWVDGRVHFQTGASPKLDDLPGTTGGKPKPLGADFPLTLDEGSGQLRAVITKAGFDIQDVPHKLATTRKLSVGTMFDEENYSGFFCVGDRDGVYIGVPTRSMDSSQLWVYRNRTIREMDFSHWKRVGAGKNDPLGFVGITLQPVRVGSGLVGFGQRFGEAVVNSKNPPTVLLDFSSKTIYHTAQDVLAIAGSRSGHRGAMLICNHAGKIPGSTDGKLYLISVR